MTHQVPDFYVHVSERLSSLLDNVGYSLTDRERKVRSATEAEILLNVTSSFDQSLMQRSPYICGSRSEGSTGPGLYSDIDILIVNNICKVVIDQHECQPDKINYLMVRDDHTPPGYVKLQRVEILSHHTPVSLCPDEYFAHKRDSYGRTAEVNWIPKNVHNVGTMTNPMISPINQTNAGPALHYRHSVNLYPSNWMYVCRCLDWPREGSEWFRRHRLHGWPTAQHIENARKYGCFVKPVCHPSSDEHDVEWQLSFSLAERDLTRSFENTVMKVYILLKMIKKTFIEPHLGNAFSSYHCKVCILWMRENTSPELWRTENLLFCLTLCIRQLLDWATMGYCPDYFIAENNINERKLVGATRFKLQMIFKYLLSQDCRFLLAIDCCSIGQLLAGGFKRIDHTLSILEEFMFDNEIFIGAACECRTLMMRKPPQSYNSLLNSVRRLLYALMHAPPFLQVSLRYVVMIICEKLGFYTASICKANVEYLFQETIDVLVRRASVFLSVGINSDATSVRLKLCALGIELENYDLTEICLQQISDRCMRFMYSCTGFKFMGSRVLSCNLVSFLENLLTQRYGSLELLQNQSSFTVLYHPLEISIAPVPLRMEMFKSFAAPPVLGISERHFWYDWAVVDSLFCLHFLQFLNFGKQSKIQHKQVAMGNMIHVIRTEPDIPHRDTALNLLGYCFLLENQPQKAFLCFLQSLKILPHHNAAKFYMGLLFQKANVTQRKGVTYH